MKESIDRLNIDFALIRKIQLGDVTAFEKLFNHYWEELFISAYDRTGNREDAEDIVQDVFMGIWAQRGRLEIATSIRAYLRTMLKYTIIRRASRADLHARVVDHLLGRMQVMEDTILNSIHAGELNKTISEVISTFPENMQRVFLLRSNDYSVAEIADALLLSPQTVKNYNSEALQRLRKVISKRHPDINNACYLMLMGLMIS